MKILLIEPNRIIAKQYCRYLKTQGHSVEWREDAQSGVVAADKSMPDIVIVELLLAGHSGVEFLYEFRSYADWQKIPAIILSSATKLSMGLSDTTLNELGVTTYLYKPHTSLIKLENEIQKSFASKYA